MRLNDPRLTVIENILSAIGYKDWAFRVDAMGDGHFLQVVFAAPDNLTGREELQHGRKWYISRYATKSEIVNTAFLAVLTAEEHEVRERFTYRGEMIYTPHFDVDYRANETLVEERRAA